MEWVTKLWVKQKLGFLTLIRNQMVGPFNTHFLLNVISKKMFHLLRSYCCDTNNKDTIA